MHIETLKGILRSCRSRRVFRSPPSAISSHSRPSASRFARLEEKFKRRLLERVRGRREVKLTPAGEVFYRESQECSRRYEQLRRASAGWSARSAARSRSRRFTASGCTSCRQRCGEFMTKFPSAKIDLEYSRTTRVVRDVLSGTVELGVLAFPEPRRGITITPMPDNRLCSSPRPITNLQSR